MTSTSYLFEIEVGTNGIQSVRTGLLTAYATALFATTLHNAANARA